MSDSDSSQSIEDTPKTVQTVKKQKKTKVAQEIIPEELGFTYNPDLDRTLPKEPLWTSYTYATKIPEGCKYQDSQATLKESQESTAKPVKKKGVVVEDENDNGVMLGVDEAGRGPVLGPMVYAVAYCPSAKKAELMELGVADSKTLSEADRERMYELLRGENLLPPTNDDRRDYKDWSGYAFTVLSPQDISSSMLRRNKYNLNALAHDTTINLIQLVLDRGVHVTQIYVDTVGPPESYQQKLAQRFPQVPRIVVTKKADSLYPIVSAASIVAKVTRDRVLRYWKYAEGQELDTIPSAREFGSGYPSDPNTVQWLKGPAGFDKLFGGPSIMRFSWSTVTKILDEDCLAVEWPDYEKEEEAAVPITSFFTKQPKTHRDVMISGMKLKSVGNL